MALGVSASSGTMLFVCVLYIVALGSIYWYWFEVHYTGTAAQGYNIKFTVNQGLFQSKMEVEYSCYNKTIWNSAHPCPKSQTKTSRLTKWRDICAGAPAGDGHQKRFCQSQNVVISMMVLGIVASFIAGVSACSPLAKPLCLAATAFSFVFGAIAMSVYTANRFAWFGTDAPLLGPLNPNRSPTNWLFLIVDASKVFSHNTGEHGDDGSRHFHFAFAFCVIGWTLSFITFFLLAAGGRRGTATTATVIPVSAPAPATEMI